MELVKIHGHTYYIPGATNTGVFTTKSGYCVLIDSGINNTVAHKISKVLAEKGLKPRYLLTTHGHADHFGAHNLLKELYPGLEILASPGEKVYMENNLQATTTLYGAVPYDEIKVPLLFARSTAVDITITPGPLKLLDQHLEAIATPGHTAGHLAFLTPDGVLFSGDAVFDQGILAKYPLPFLLDIKAELATLEVIAGLEIKYLLPAHGQEVITEVEPVLEANRRQIANCLDIIVELLSQPLTREDLLAQVAILEDITMDIPQYFLNLSSLSAFLSYLKDEGRISCSVENGKLYFFAI
ncbi:MBL fold metallo-hydrolase [Neomoorella thermoacetica]|uniref:Zn-dependent hydrolases, including glyoxylases n=3 Tax=Neomoorella thermoacetica TaxID=1525 RepID=A0A0S6UAA5_NEOTH|nr:MBL fold metallo-hydrolase [Moorella thermoacetica]AKX93102.1 putative metallo-hydrolase YflN [Moorella thermoacetica]AKX95652.1 putative metallo-hydrolase YflN [Moorella thermoacetica]OIQ08765.1 putative metallo-hydrolase YflN [Moorella thermoacetica]OIQ53380.1 putative metallo-hydrolase YflN [Moorella thermoacetica]OIQ53484.1 putative metallo-hydrolase YflN [Moorella thermoacetica]